MKTIILSILLGLSVSVFANQRIKVYYEQTQNGYKIYADNDEFCPVSIKINFKLTNLKSTEGNNKVFVVSAKSKKNNITDLVIVKKGREIGFNFITTTNYGNHNQSDYNDDFVYYLPYKKGESYSVFQGYNGSLSHQNENALDFTMPIGTEIFSARDGIVTKVVQNNSKHCEQKKCSKYNNYILVYHSDGTFAEYTHIKKNGSIVKEGDKITIGQLVGYSGNVGRSSGPHLHFVVFLQKIDNRKTIKTKFLMREGGQAELLEEKKEYKRDY